MKKGHMVLAVFFVVFIMFLLRLGNFHVNAKNETDLLKIVSLLQNEKINITEWSLYAREKIDHFDNLNEVKKYGYSLKGKFSRWQWETDTVAGHWEMKGTLPHKGFEEVIKILVNLEGAPQAYVVYELRGRAFTEESERFIKEHWSATAFDIFRGNASIFSCVKGEFNDNIEATLSKSAERLLALLQAEKKESIEEKNFISTSAYSPIFADSIHNGDQEMNVQIGIRSEGLGAKTTLVVGTPIITIEY